MKINHWPLSERPRERLLAQGAKNLSNAELLAILLRIGVPGKTALDLARELLSQFGGLKQLPDASPQQLCQAGGMGKAKYAMLLAAFELGKRCLEENNHLGEKLSSSQASQGFLAAKLRGQSQEVFACLFLNNHNHIIAFEELFHGSLTETAIYPREIIKRALAHNAAKIILSHNHPSGDAAPSQADRLTTQHLKQALSLVDIQVLDHIIIGQQENFSFAEKGWL
jgi:DNA repair protein RadC